MFPSRVFLEFIRVSYLRTCVRREQNTSLRRRLRGTRVEKLNLWKMKRKVEIREGRGHEDSKGLSFELWHKIFARGTKWLDRIVYLVFIYLYGCQVSNTIILLRKKWIIYKINEGIIEKKIILWKKLGSFIELTRKILTNNSQYKKNCNIF